MCELTLDPLISFPPTVTTLNEAMKDVPDFNVSLGTEEESSSRLRTVSQLLARA